MIPCSTVKRILSTRKNISAIKTFFNLLSDKDQLIVRLYLYIPKDNWTSFGMKNFLLPSMQHDIFNGLLNIPFSQVNQKFI